MLAASSTTDMVSVAAVAILRTHIVTVWLTGHCINVSRTCCTKVSLLPASFAYDSEQRPKQDPRWVRQAVAFSDRDVPYLTYYGTSTYVRCTQKGFLVSFWCMRLSEDKLEVRVMVSSGSMHQKLVAIAEILRCVMMTSKRLVLIQ